MMHGRKHKHIHNNLHLHTICKWKYYNQFKSRVIYLKRSNSHIQPETWEHQIIFIHTLMYIHTYNVMHASQANMFWYSLS